MVVLKNQLSVFITTVIFFAVCGFSAVIAGADTLLTIFYPSIDQSSQPGYMTRCTDCRNPSLSVLAVGDLMMSGGALSVIRTRGADYPFDSTRSVIQMADLAMANLEAPISTQGRPFKKRFTFRVPPSFVSGIYNAGFDVMTLANNHIMDYGDIGLYDTIEWLDLSGLAHCGAGTDIEEAHQGTICSVKGWKVAFLAYSLTYPSEFWATQFHAGTAYPNLNRLRSRIQSLKDSTHLVIVSFHWGGELMTRPKAYQRYYAHQAIDFGADLVIGHHPHILQGLEYYNGKLIAYSLGNYVFGSYSGNSKISVLLKVRFGPEGPLYAEIIPITVDNNRIYFQPRILRGRKREVVINHLNELSELFSRNPVVIPHSGLVGLYGFK